jgi:hypothetical protein
MTAAQLERLHEDLQRLRLFKGRERLEAEVTHGRLLLYQRHTQGRLLDVSMEDHA